MKSIPTFGSISWIPTIVRHPVQSIMDDDIAGMIGRFIQGVDVNEDTMVLDLMYAMGSASGYYLDKRHPFDWWRHDRYSPVVSDDLGYDKLMQSGKKDSLALSREKLGQILGAHDPLPLTDDQQLAFNRIFGEVRKYYQGKGVL